MNRRFRPHYRFGCVALSRRGQGANQSRPGQKASQIFANACVECHKEPRGLAKGRSASALTDFLREHYTTNRSTGGRACRLRPGRPQRRHRANGARRRRAEQSRCPSAPRLRSRSQIGKAKSHGRPEERSTRNPAGQPARPSEQASPNETTDHHAAYRRAGATAHNRRKEQEPSRQRRANPIPAGCKRRPQPLRSRPAQASRQIANRAGNRVRRLPLRPCRRKPHPAKPRRPRPAKFSRSARSYPRLKLLGAKLAGLSLLGGRGGLGARRSPSG